MCSPINILLVDDEPRNLDVIETILDRPDYRLIRAQNADEALRELISHEIAVIVLDIRLPGTSGFELAQLIKHRKKTQHIPIIFLTAYFQEDEHVLQGYDAGAVDYLSKPCNPAILRSKVAVFVDLFCKSRALEAEVQERREAEQRIRELNQQLAHRVDELAAANAELEAFSYSVSHDLRAPLRQVVGFINLLTEAAEGQLDPRSAEYLPLIQDSVTRMGRLIDDLLEFSRIGRTELQASSVSLRSLLDQALQTLQPATEGRVIQWKIEPLPDVHGDATTLRQVLANLLDNALKFTRPRPAAHIEVGCLAQEDEDVVFVRDNGVGFDPRYANRLFGVFQRLHSREEFEGTGIGLASVRRIIHRHGGRTWAESALGRETTVYFSLPRRQVASHAPLPVNQP
ncbi:MAG: sensor histidine kinase [Pirellulaceae bacterium]